MSASSGKGWGPKDQDDSPLPHPRVRILGAKQSPAMKPVREGRSVEGLRPSDHEVLVRLSQALWSEQDHAQAALIEAMSLGSLSDSTAAEFAERVAALLMKKALSEFRPAEMIVSSPFYRLPVQSRLVLAALHGHSRWSCQRIGRIFGLFQKIQKDESEGAARSVESSHFEDWVSRLAWSSRLELFWESGHGVFPLQTQSTSKFAQVSCPEYDARAPWSQRFFDEEMPAKERLFLQNHLMACESCRTILARTRKLFSETDIALNHAGIQGSLEESAEVHAANPSLSELQLLRRSLRAQSTLNFWDSLRIHFRDPVNRRVLWLGLACVLLAWLYQLWR